MSAYAGTRQDVHYEHKRTWTAEFSSSDECLRENNALQSELGRKHLLGSGVGKRYKVRDVKKSKKVKVPGISGTPFLSADLTRMLAF